MTTLVEYYQNLLLVQYQEGPKALATIEALVNCAICDSVLREMESAFDLETAIGAQLDILGDYLGFGRRVEAVPDADFFNMTDYDDPSEAVVGMTDYGDAGANATSSFYRYSMASQTVAELSDEDYRLILNWKLKFNSLCGSLHAIAEAVYEVFGDGLICFDHANMSLTYAVKQVSEKYAKILSQQDLLPKPMGVKFGGLFAVEDVSAVYGFASYVGNRSVVGFADYETDPNPVAQVLSYADRID